MNSLNHHFLCQGRALLTFKSWHLRLFTLVCLFDQRLEGRGPRPKTEANYDLFQALTLDIIGNFVHILCIIAKGLLEWSQLPFFMSSEVFIDFQLLGIKSCSPLFVCLIRGLGAESDFYNLFQALKYPRRNQNFVYILIITDKWLFE